MNSIKRKVGEKCSFTGGAEETPTCTISKFSAPGSLNHGEKNIRILQERHIANSDGTRTIDFPSVTLSVETMKSMIAWAESED